MLRPGLPKKAFQMRPPTIDSLSRSAKRKRNGAQPGLDSITYVPFKKCRSLIVFLHELCIRMWKDLEVADDWSQALLKLLKKGSQDENLDVVSEFRPIAMTSTMGKIIFTVLSDRLQTFLVRNSYIPRKMQKGFLSGIAGCIEHSFMLYEALKEAKDEQRQIVIAWIDLANAYGSVRHNLIQFALDWYHIPKEIQALLFNYYEKLMAKIVTKEWSTDFFLFDIGLFQGCVISAILFLCVFQLLLDFLKPLQEKHGYLIKQINIRAIAEAYADDLALVTKDARGNQICCDRTDIWLEWTKTMRAKPAKCVTFAMKQFDRRIKNETFQQVNKESQYSLFDPKLTIAGQPMNFILNTNSDGFKSRHFKFLGRQINFNLNEKEIKQKITSALIEDIATVSKSKVNGLMKLWLYQFGILPRMTWPLMVHDLDLSFAKSLQTLVQPSLKKWSGIGRTVDEGLLYRSRANLGLNLTPIADHYTAMQLAKAQLLRSSKDDDVRNLWASKTTREKKLTRHFRVSKLCTEATAQVLLDTRFPTQNGRLGLGHGKFKANHSVAELRKMVSITARSFAEDRRVQHAQGLAQQGIWTTWKENVMPFDLSWKNLIYGSGEHIIKFVLNATVNWVKTPDTLKTWGYKQTAFCPLCNHPQCTLHHIISNCPFALKNKRYTWRHDSVLLYLQATLQELIERANCNKENHSNPLPKLEASFVKTGERRKQRTVYHKTSILDGATDWKMLVDFDHKQIVYPPEITATPERPDIVIWSKKLKKVINLELTCPAEEGIEAAKTRKEARYFGLKCNAKDRKWTAQVRTIEVGARGFVGKEIPRTLKDLGRNPRQINADIKNLSALAIRCTYAIYLARDTKDWDTSRELLTVEDASTTPSNPTRKGPAVYN